MFEALPRVSVAQTNARNCFADEVAIDFPSLGSLVERMRTSLLGSESHDSLTAEIPALAIGSTPRRRRAAGRSAPGALFDLWRPRRSLDRAVSSM